MAEFLTTAGWPEPNSLGMTLRDSLPDEYIVVEGATVQGHALGTVVAGPQGLFVLHAKPWAGQVRPAWDDPWHVLLPSGVEETYSNPAAEAQRDTAPLATFVRDELHTREIPAIHPLLVLTHPEASLASGIAPDIMVTTPDSLPNVITTMPVPSLGGLIDENTRSAVAHSLVERRLSASQRATEPFIFRTGGRLGISRTAWTIQEAVRHMDKVPEDGIYHLKNGTLAAWLEAQGATQLARPARAVLDTRASDPRVALERFLLATGLVSRPRLHVRPRPVNLGCVISGNTCSARLQIRKGGGRGYLFGDVSTSEPWLRVEPRSFRGGPVEVVVTADTSMLPIGSMPLHADLLIDSSASSEPLAVPVQLRVSGEPAGLNRYGLRPLLNALAAGLCGAAIGGLLGAIGSLGAPEHVASQALFWALVVAGLWAVFGATRGLGQRPAWTTRYALVRYLVKIGLWVFALAAAAVISLLIWQWLSSQEGPRLASKTGLRLVLLAAAVAIVPATIGEMRAARRSQDSPLAAERGSLVRPAVVALATVALVAVLAAGVRLAGPTWRHLAEAGTVDTAQSWADQRWQDLNQAVQSAVDRLYLWVYDRPGTTRPAVTPTPLAAPQTQEAP